MNGADFETTFRRADALTSQLDQVLGRFRGEEPADDADRQRSLDALCKALLRMDEPGDG